MTRQDGEGATPLDPDEAEGLIPTHISNRAEVTLIHPFPNENGRHTRLATDVLLISHGRSRFTWSRSDLHRVGDSRERYIAALRAADGQGFEPLFDFLQLSSRLDLPIRKP